MVRLRERGYPGRWLQQIFEEIKYKVERPTALKPITRDNATGDPVLHVLKLTHNPIWDGFDLNPLWREFNETWKEFGMGYPELQFMVSFKKPHALGDQLNTINRETLNTYHTSIAAPFRSLFSQSSVARRWDPMGPGPGSALLQISKKTRELYLVFSVPH
ncbi:hypothetical protein B0H16DRAFT_1475434 [Mycena metata]|uniref:Uncharacterized protein n=1 Tax=Mycena metata TaxID=1033252 RepID=A0AAD7MIB1_9AGAR|nr:hypothetical protein B0H16DRAFT_1475434 [Mycena metata]